MFKKFLNRRKFNNLLDINKIQRIVYNYKNDLNELEIIPSSKEDTNFMYKTIKDRFLVFQEEDYDKELYHIFYNEIYIRFTSSKRSAFFAKKVYLNKPNLYWKIWSVNNLFLISPLDINNEQKVGLETLTEYKINEETYCATIAGCVRHREFYDGNFIEYVIKQLKPIFHSLLEEIKINKKRIEKENKESQKNLKNIKSKQIKEFNNLYKNEKNLF